MTAWVAEGRFHAGSSQHHVLILLTVVGTAAVPWALILTLPWELAQRATRRAQGADL